LQVLPVEENTGLGLNIFLYLGLGLVAIGLVMVFVGVGEKGFKTVEMRLVGPGLVLSGLSLACLRIFCCLIGENYGACQDDMEKDEHEGDDTEQRQNRNRVQEYEENKGEENLLPNIQSFNVGDGKEVVR
jgi:hypothetical protein